MQFMDGSKTTEGTEIGINNPRMRYSESFGKYPNTPGVNPRH